MHVVKSKDPDQTDNSTTPPTIRAVRLKTLADVRRFGSRVVNQLIRKEITESEARAYGYLLSIMSGVIKDSDIEDRLKALEKSMEAK